MARGKPEKDHRAALGRNVRVASLVKGINEMMGETQLKSFSVISKEVAKLKEEPGTPPESPAATRRRAATGRPVTAYRRVSPPIDSCELINIYMYILYVYIYIYIFLCMHS